MNSTFTTEKQTELFHALRLNPLKKSIKVKKHYNALEQKHSLFQNELASNISQALSVRETLEYLTKTLLQFQNAYMFYEGSFELMLFPEDFEQQESENQQKMNSYNKVHCVIFNMSIRSIEGFIHFVKYSQENNLNISNTATLSNYIINRKKCKAIDIVEIGYALYHSDYFRNRTGDTPQLYEFIENLGRYFGIEILNVRQRISQLHERVKNPLVFIEKLTTIYLHNINLKVY